MTHMMLPGLRINLICDDDNTASRASEEARAAPTAVVLHELVVQDRRRRLAGGVEELLEALPRPVVDAVGAQNVQLVQCQVLLYGPQGLDLHSGCTYCVARSLAGQSFGCRTNEQTCGACVMCLGYPCHITQLTPHLGHNISANCQGTFQPSLFLHAEATTDQHTRSYLAADADKEKSLHVQRLDGGEHVQVGRQRRLYALCCQDVLFTPRDHLGGCAVGCSCVLKLQTCPSKATGRVCRGRRAVDT